MLKKIEKSNIASQKKETKALLKPAPTKQLAFLKYYFSEEIDGKKNPCFCKVGKAAKRAGYKESYGKSMLARVQRQNNEMSQKVAESRKELVEAYTTKGIDSEWIANLIERLGNKNAKSLFRGNFVDSGDPDSFAARTALDFIAKTQGLYYDDEKHPSDPYNLAGKSKEELVDIILGRTGEEGSSSD